MKTELISEEQPFPARHFHLNKGDPDQEENCIFFVQVKFCRVVFFHFSLRSPLARWLQFMEGWFSPRILFYLNIYSTSVVTVLRELLFPGRTFHNFRAAKSVDSRFWYKNDCRSTYFEALLLTVKCSVRFCSKPKKSICNSNQQA